MFIVYGVWLSFCGAEKSVYQIESIDVRNSEGKLRFWIRFLTLGEIFLFGRELLRKWGVPSNCSVVDGNSSMRYRT